MTHDDAVTIARRHHGLDATPFGGISRVGSSGKRPCGLDADGWVVSMVSE
jgi:hypothetical protein